MDVFARLKTIRQPQKKFREYIRLRIARLKMGTISVLADQAGISRTKASEIINSGPEVAAHENTLNPFAKALYFADWRDLVKAFEAGDVDRGIAGNGQWVERPGVSDRDVVIALVNMSLGESLPSQLEAEMLPFIDVETAARLVQRFGAYIAKRAVFDTLGRR